MHHVWKKFPGVLGKEGGFFDSDREQGINVKAGYWVGC